MIKYIIRNKETGKFLRRTKSYGVHNEWVTSADDATLINSGSAASQIAQRFDKDLPHSQRYTARRGALYPSRYSVEVIKVGVLIYPASVQPFMDGVLNGNRS
jgi:hypothetical protein